MPSGLQPFARGARRMIAIGRQEALFRGLHETSQRPECPQGHDTQDTGVALHRRNIRSDPGRAKHPVFSHCAKQNVGSAQPGTKCLARVVPLGERHLRQIIHEYVEHYRAAAFARHQLITAPNDNAAMSRRVLCRERLGGVLNYYRREAG
jgi:hypothetical protein